MLNFKNKKYQKLKKWVFTFNFWGPLAPSLDANVKILLKKVQCRYPGYLQVKFYNKLTDSSPDHSGHVFFSIFWPLGLPLGRGGEIFFGTYHFALAKIFKFGKCISSCLRVIDEKRG